MKKIRIIIALSFIFIGSLMFKLFYVSTNNNSSIKYNIMIGNTKSATFPSINAYTVSVTCTSGKGTVTWNPKLATPAWEFKFENGYVNNNGTYTRTNITSNDSCDIVFTPRTSSNKLNTYIKSLLNGNTQVNAGSNGILKNEGTASAITFYTLNSNPTYTPLAKENYGTAQYDSTGGTIESKYTFTNNKWSNTAPMTSYTNIYNKITIPSTGVYTLCWTNTNTSSSYSFYAYAPNSTTTVTSGYNKSAEQCYDYGYLTSSDYINISAKSAGAKKITFYLKSSTNYTSTSYYHDIGIRYEGANPDNYIKFNNELWRIIGIFREAKTTSLSESDTYYTKIIRNESIGGYAYNGVSSNGAWWSKSDGSVSTLNYLLNHYYIGDEDNYDGTGTTNCKFYSTSVTRNCDYRVIGIQPGWRDMIINTTWYTAAGVNSSTASTSFSGERGSTAGKAGGELSYKDTTTNKYSKVGLMYPSDYLYSGSGASARWLLQNGYEWIISPSSSSASYAWIVNNSGSLNGAGSDVTIGFAVRPTVYLSSNVYITGGTGTLLDPYTIAM